MRQIEEERQEGKSHYSEQEVNQLVGESVELHRWWEQNPLLPSQNLFQAELQRTENCSYALIEQPTHLGQNLGMQPLPFLQVSQVRLLRLWSP